MLGGRHLHDEFYAVYVEAAEASDVAAALHDIDREWFRQRFRDIDGSAYRGAQDDEDFGYTWSNFIDVRAFYARAAEGGFAVLFTAT